MCILQSLLNIQSFLAMAMPFLLGTLATPIPTPTSITYVYAYFMF